MIERRNWLPDRRTVGFLCMCISLGFLIAISSCPAVAQKEVVLHSVASTGSHGRMMSYAAELFEQETGIKVELEPLSHEARRTKIFNDLIMQTGQNDIVMMDGQSWAEIIWPYLEDLEPYFAGDGFDPVEDHGVIPATIDATRAGPDGHRYGLPYRYSAWILFYRTDLFEERGVPVPKTWDELYEAAEKLTFDSNGDGDTDVYGTAIMGRRGTYSFQNIEEWVTLNGGNLIARDYSRVMVSDPAARSIVELYFNLYKNQLVPPGSATYVQESCITALQQGRIAFWSSWNSYSDLFVDPEQCMFPDRIGFAVMPRPEDESVEQYIPISGWSFGINKASAHKEEAWQFIKWVTSPRVQKILTMEFGNGPVSMSVLEDPEVQEANPATLAILDSLKKGIVRMGYQGYYVEVEDAVAYRVSEALLENQDVDDVIGAIEKDLQEILTKHIQSAMREGN